MKTLTLIVVILLCSLVLKAQPIPDVPLINTDSLEQATSERAFKPFSITLSTTRASPEYAQFVRIQLSDSATNQYSIIEDVPFVQFPPNQNGRRAIRIKRSEYRGLDFITHFVEETRLTGAHLFEFELGNAGSTEVDSVFISSPQQLALSARRVQFFTDPSAIEISTLWESYEGEILPKTTLNDSWDAFFVSTHTKLFLRLSADTLLHLPALQSQQDAILEGGGDNDGDGIDDAGYGVSYQAGWNMVSTPIVFSQSSQNQPSIIFGKDVINQANIAFEWVEGEVSTFMPTQTLEAGKGYWIYADAIEQPMQHKTRYFGDLEGFEAIVETPVKQLNPNEYQLIGTPAALSILEGSLIADTDIWSFVRGGYRSLLDGLADNYKTRIGNDILLQPGRAYWIKSRENMDFSLVADAGLQNPWILNKARNLNKDDKSFVRLEVSYPKTGAVQPLYLKAEDDVVSPALPEGLFQAVLDDAYLLKRDSTARLMIKNAVDNFHIRFHTDNPYESLKIESKQGQLLHTLKANEMLSLSENEYIIRLEKKDRSELQIEELPHEFQLYPNQPNPFNPTTLLRYDLPRATNFSLELYNSLGQQVRILEQGFKTAGTYEYVLNASNMSSGMYFARLKAGNKSMVQKLMLLK